MTHNVKFEVYRRKSQTQCSDFILKHPCQHVVARPSRQHVGAAGAASASRFPCSISVISVISTRSVGPAWCCWYRYSSLVVAGCLCRSPLFGEDVVSRRGAAATLAEALSVLGVIGVLEHSAAAGLSPGRLASYPPSRTRWSARAACSRPRAPLGPPGSLTSPSVASAAPFSRGNAGTGQGARGSAMSS